MTTADLPAILVGVAIGAPIGWLLALFVIAATIIPPRGD